MGGCLACYERPQVNSSVPKGLKFQASRRNSSISEDFWTNSTFDMDNNIAVQSHGSISSISTSYLPVDSQLGACSSTDSAEFVNHGLILWNQTRQHWIGNKASEKRAHHAREPKSNSNMSYESLLGSNRPAPEPIPLAEMVLFLVDTWEQEGLYS